MLNFSQRSAHLVSRRRLIAAGAAIAVLSACKDFTSVGASYDNFTDSTIFFAINGSPPGAPTAINLWSGSSFRADQAFAYDLAFDINAVGKAVIIPSRALATTYSNPYPVGLQILPTETFGSLKVAPRSGYILDTAVVVGLGQVVAVESHDPGTCGFAIKGQSFFSKLIVTAIDLPNRILTVRLTVNKNCGFHSLQPDGKPTD